MLNRSPHGTFIPELQRRQVLLLLRARCSGDSPSPSPPSLSYLITFLFLDEVHLGAKIRNKAFNKCLSLRLREMLRKRHIQKHRSGFLTEKVVEYSKYPILGTDFSKENCPISGYTYLSLE